MDISLKKDVCAMKMFDIIARKRDGKALTYEELQFFVNGIVAGSIPDYQTTALMMAIYLNGMSKKETSELCMLMASSGDTLEFSDEYITVDKHSTGGVGDKTSLIVTPVAAACGLTVAKMSGRGLGHTGGTVDKLESIPGMKMDMSMAQFEATYKKTGLCLSGQSGNMVPADKIMYALRDVTATISSIPLIATSIMSKKLAAGAKNIVLDVKTGSGAFMENPEEAFELAEKMVDIGTANGRKVSALVTMMDNPLGRTVGNSIEVMEAVEILKGEHAGSDLYNVSVALAAELIHMTSGRTIGEATETARKKIRDGSAYKKLCEMITAQGGDASVLEKGEGLKKPLYTHEIKAPEDGFIVSIDAKTIGIISMNLGAGRSKKSDPIDYSAGIRILKKPGEEVIKGEPMAVLYSDIKDMDNQERIYLGACEISDIQLPERKLILGRVTHGRIEEY